RHCHRRADLMPADPLVVVPVLDALRLALVLPGAGVAHEALVLVRHDGIVTRIIADPLHGAARMWRPAERYAELIRADGESAQRLSIALHPDEPWPAISVRRRPGAVQTIQSCLRTYVLTPPRRRTKVRCVELPTDLRTELLGLFEE